MYRYRVRTTDGREKERKRGRPRKNIEDSSPPPRWPAHRTRANYGGGGGEQHSIGSGGTMIKDEVLN